MLTQANLLQAAVTAVSLNDYNFTIMVGEESGDFPSLYASLFLVHLPNTGIAAKIPKGYTVRGKYR